MSIVIETGNPHDPAATKLLRDSHALMQKLFNPEDNHYLSIDALCASEIRFLVARVNGEIRGCCALAVRTGYGEVKSMFVDPQARGLGLAGQLLEHIQSVARSEKLAVLRLETGDLLHSAHRVYERNGFVKCGVFGDYQASESSIFMEKYL